MKKPPHSQNRPLATPEGRAAQEKAAGASSNSAEPVELSTSRNPTEPPARPTPRARILLAHSQTERRAVLSALLAEQYDVEAVADGAAAWQAARRQAPDLILLDLILPDLDLPDLGLSNAAAVGNDGL